MRTVRVLAGGIGIGIVGCVVHSTILANGGYEADRAPMLIGLAAGLAIGAAAIGVCWREGRTILAMLIGLAILAGEAFTLIQTAERTIAYRDGHQAPIIANEAERKAAIHRLSMAIQAKAEADKAILAKASKKGCATNCRALLEQQSASAKAELDAARAELAKTPAPASPSPLADRLGIAPWKIDVVSAALVSIAANGLGALLIAFAAHGRHIPPQTNTPAVEIMTTSRDPISEADAFARHHFRPSSTGRVPLQDIRRSYHAWCEANGRDPLPDREIGSSLNQLFSRVGLVRDKAEIVGITWADRTIGA